MSVTELKKITIVSTRSLKAEVVKELEEAGAVQITDFHLEPQMEELEPEKDEEYLFSELDTVIHQIQYCLDFTNHYSPPKKRHNLFFQTKNPIAHDKFFQIGSSFPYKKIFNQCQKLDQKLIELKNRENRIDHLKYLLNAWISLDLNLEETKGFSRLDVFLILLNDNTNWVDFQRKVEETAGELSHLELFELDRGRKGGLIIILKEKSTPIKQLLKEYDIEQLEPVTGYKGPPKAILAKLEEEQAEIESEREKVKERIKTLLKFQPKLMIAYDYAQLLKARKEVESHLGYTERTLFVEGWITAKNGEALKDNLSRRFREIEILCRDPLPVETPPILLSNPFPLKPFEQITRLYSLPNRDEFDPTPFVFPFFFLFFGICLSEAAYGIIISLSFYLALKRVKLGDNPRGFFMLFCLGGLSSIIFGALTGSWFGNLMDVLPGINISLKGLKDSLMIVNPIINPIPLLIFSLLLGVIQIYTGLFLKMVISFKGNSVRGGLLSEGVQILLLTTFLSWVMSIANIFPPEWKSITNGMFIFSLLLVAITKWRAEQTLLSKLVATVFGIYDLVGYLGDILSYSRLFALGLATGVIAIIVNTLITALKDIPVIGIFLIPLIFCFGHLFNLILSTLGAFIHSLRLQYVEYFTKFYQGGGKPFEPYGIKTKYVELIPST